MIVLVAVLSQQVFAVDVAFRRLDDHMDVFPRATAPKIEATPPAAQSESGVASLIAIEFQLYLGNVLCFVRINCW